MEGVYTENAGAVFCQGQDAKMK